MVVIVLRGLRVIGVGKLKQHLVTLFELLDAWCKLKLGNNNPYNEPNSDCMRRGNGRAPHTLCVDDRCEGNVLLHIH